jgi:predicted ester cyclase
MQQVTTVPPHANTRSANDRSIDGTREPAAGLAPCARPSPRATVMAFYEAFDQGALGRFDGIDEGFQARVFGSTVLDWPGFFAFAQAFREGFPAGHHAFDFVVAEGDNVATIGHYRGRHERPFMGVAATGKQVDFVVMHVDTVRDGRVVEHRGIGDINAMWAQLGVAPPVAA